jgi:hypothetical protein
MGRGAVVITIRGRRSRWFGQLGIDKPILRLYDRQRSRRVASGERNWSGVLPSQRVARQGGMRMQQACLCLRHQTNHRRALCAD